MPFSNTTFDNEIRHWVTTMFPNRQLTRILDVGAGAGKYREILFDYPHVDALEVWKPYIDKYRLRDRYEHVVANDVTKAPADFFKPYNLIILGDVLEHIDAVEAMRLLESLSGALLVAVPYQYEQGAVDGNTFETHLQPDLTPELMAKRYPQLKLLVGDEGYGVYTNTDRTLTNGRPYRRLPESQPFPLDRAVLSTARVAICTPLLSSHVDFRYCASLTETVRRCVELGVGVEVLMTSGHSVATGRNRLVASFMAGDYTHLLFVDSDHAWKPENLFRLLQMDKDVVGIVARRKTPQVVFAGNIPAGEVWIDETGAMEIADIGTGFVLVRRQVFEKMFEAYPELKAEHPAPNASIAEREAYHLLYQFVIDQTSKREYSEDITFCRRWRNIGGKVYCDASATISHFGDYDYRGSISSLFIGKVDEQAV